MPSIARATFNCYISWNSYLQGLLTLDISTLNGADTFGTSAFDTSFSGPYDDVSDRLASFTLDGGRADNLTTMDALSGQLVLRDPDDRFNPENTASPLYGQLEDKLHPVLLTASNNTAILAPADTLAPDDDLAPGSSTDVIVAKPIVYAFTRKITFNPGRRKGKSTVTIDLVDLFYWLSRGKNDTGAPYPTIAATGPTTVGAAIGLILDAIGWTDPQMRAIATGSHIPNFVADGSDSALSLIEGLLEVDRGIFYVNQAGQAVYEDPLARAARSSAASIVDLMADMQPTVDFDTVKNYIETLKTGGALQVNKDDLSIGKIGRSDWGKIESTYFTSDADANDVGAYLISIAKKARPPVYSFRIDNREDTLLTQILTRELGDVITVSEDQTGSAFDGFIERRAISYEAGHLSAAYTLSKRTQVGFRFGTSTLDGTDQLVFGRI